MFKNEALCVFFAELMLLIAILICLLVLLKKYYALLELYLPFFAENVKNLERSKNRWQSFSIYYWFIGYQKEERKYVQIS